MPIIQVNMIEGRTNEQKTALARGITDAVVEALGAKRESVRVLIHEMGAYDFAAGGVTMAERRAAANGGGAQASAPASSPQTAQPS